MSIFLIIFSILVVLFIVNYWLKVQRVKKSTRQLISSLGGVETIFAPLISKIEDIFACDNVMLSWNKVIVCDAPKGSSALKSDITFRLRHTLYSYVITYTSTGKSLAPMSKTWVFSSTKSFDNIWLTICDSIGVSPEILEPKVKPNFIPDNSIIGLPNTSNPTARFNLFYSLEFLPTRIEEYNKGKLDFSKVIACNNLPAEFKIFSNKIHFSADSLQDVSNIELLLCEMPNCKSISEVKLLLIIHDTKLYFAKLYSLEYSSDGFCIFEITKDTHANICFTSDRNEFLNNCLANFDSSIKQKKENSEILPTSSEPSPSTIKSSNNNSVHKGGSTTPLLEFARIFGKLQLGQFKNRETGEEFSSCIFTNKEGKKTYVAFANSIGALTPAQIIAQKKDLEVVTLESGNYSLRRKGSYNDNLLFNPQYISECLNCINYCTSLFINKNKEEIGLLDYTQKEITLFVVALYLGGENISRLRSQKGNLLLEKVFSIFVGNLKLSEVIDQLQGMSIGYFADSMHGSQVLSEALKECTSVSFEEHTVNGEKIRLLNLFVSINFYTMVHLSDEVKNISLQEVFERQNQLYINETCKNMSPCAVCTPLNEWPILETINRGDIEYRKFINEFIIDRIEQYYRVYHSQTEVNKYKILANVLLRTPFCTDFRMFSYDENDNIPLDDSTLIGFEQSLNDIINFIKSNELP